MVIQQQKPRIIAYTGIPGPPHKWTWKRLRRLLTAFKQGADVQEAANIAGIGERTVHEWLQQGRSGIEPYTRLETSIERCRAVSTMGNVSAVTASRARDWKAAAWLLEHSPHSRERYGQRTDADVDVAAQALALLASRLPPPPPAAALPAIDAPLLEERTRTHEDTRVELDGRDVTDTG